MVVLDLIKQNLFMWRERGIRNIKWLGWCRQINEGLKVYKAKQLAIVPTRKSVLNSTKYWQTV